jgi:hypothetical protein
MKSEALIQLQQELGEDAGVEVFERVVKLLEKSSFSVLAGSIYWYKRDFEYLLLSLLERLEIALEQMEVLSDEKLPYYRGDDFAREKFLSLTMDLLRTKMITPRELETALKKPELSSLPWLLNSLRNEARDLFSLLVIGHPRKSENPIEQCELEELLASTKKRAA